MQVALPHVLARDAKRAQFRSQALEILRVEIAVQVALEVDIRVAIANAEQTEQRSRPTADADREPSMHHGPTIPR